MYCQSIDNNENYEGIMNSINNKSNKGEITIAIGEESVSFQPESKRSLDIEMLLLNILLYVLIFAFSFNIISTPVFLMLFYFVGMRVFMGGHDRFHASHRDRLPRFIEAIAEGFWVVLTPWDEPYDSIKKKHFTHHETHGHGKSADFDTKSDPHAAYELGGFFRVFFSCLFYEEIQLYIDIRDNKLTRSRLYRFLIYVPLLITFIVTFGWTTYLIVLLAMRMTGFSVWFVFSWVFHNPFFYKFGFSKLVPKWIILTNTILFGRRIAKGTIHHTTHHAWPGVPYDQLHKFDSAVLRHPEHAPELRPIGY